ncbi:MAG: toxin-antitoxin system HicB family antitoxin [Planctomycetaceae bacterium]|nr:toxin-antitoxin system HicB family antitoxin [Planctomycetaceae bacterium]
MPETVVHFQIRVPPNIHERLASWAKQDKASLNMLIVGLLEKALERRKSENPSAVHGLARHAH